MTAPPARPDPAAPRPAASRATARPRAASPVVAVSGYAGLDHAMLVPRLPATDTTAIVQRRLSDPWPGWGGCGPYVARRLAAEGLATRLVTWLGDDDGGHAYRALLRREGVGVDGVALSATAPTPTTYLFYEEGGRSVCFYDPGAARDAGLGTAQREALAAADWLVLTVGPRPAAEALLEGRGQRRLVWAVKADPDACPPPLVRRCLAAASVVALSAGERRFLEAATAPDDPFALLPPDAVVFLTDGGRGVHVRAGGREALVPVDALPTRDTTGAGDTFLAGALAALLRHPPDAPGVGDRPDPGGPCDLASAEAAAEAGVRAARELLAARVAAAGAGR